MSNRRITAIRILFFLLLISALCTAAYMFGKGKHFSAGEFRNWIGGYGDWAPAIFVAAYAALVTLGFPALLASTVGALVFGRGWGTVLNVIGATIGAGGAFWVSRLMAHDFVKKHLAGKKWFDSFNSGIRENGFHYMLFVRLLPVLPFNGVNFAAGVTNIRFRSFIFATLVGVIPHAFVLTNAVVEVGESAAHGFKLSPGLALAFSLFAFFGLLPALVKKRLERGDGTGKNRH